MSTCKASARPSPAGTPLGPAIPNGWRPIFRDHMTSDRSQAELAQAKQLVRERSACLLCFERDHNICHRRLVAEMIVAETGQTVVHLATP